MMVIVMLIIVMIAMMFWLLTEAFLTVEHEEVHTERVESGYEHTNDHTEVGIVRACNMRCMYCFNDGVLRVETRQERKTNQRQRTSQRREPCDGHVFPQTAHIAHI